MSSAQVKYSQRALMAGKLYQFKIVCVVNIGEMKGQDVRVASRFLWDEKNDTWVDSVFVSSELFGVAVLFAVYQE